VRRAAALLAALLLGGCATLDRNECLQANWTDLGARDGQSGYPAARLEEHREACREHGIVPDDRSYLAGREQGLRYYCTAGNGYREGRRGAAYQRVCPLEAEADFLPEYELGRELYQLEQDANELRSRIAEHERALDDPGLTREQRYGHRRELDYLYRELASLRRQMDRLERSPGMDAPGSR
jgi:hypothetical protein